MTNELVSILKRGSWYQVAYAQTNVQGGSVLLSFTVQGLVKLKKAYKYFNIVHTPEKGYLLSKDIDIELVKELNK